MSASTKGKLGPGGMIVVGGGGVGGVSLPVSIYGALVDGYGIPSAEEVLNDQALTWQFWTNMVRLSSPRFL